MAWRVHDDELAPLSCKKSVGYVDCDFLLALGREPIQDERQIEIAALRPMIAGRLGKSIELVIEKELGFVKKAADQCRLAMVDRAADNEPQ